MSSGEDSFRGVWVAMVTPWNHERHAPREKTIEMLVNRFQAAGIAGLYILGTTGEGILLSEEERMKFTEVVLEVADGRLPVIVHTGHERASIAVRLSIHAHKMGAVGIAVSAPVCYQLDKEELRKYFLTIAKVVGDYPVFLYDIPSLTGMPLSGKFLEELHNESANIAGAKVSRTDWEGLNGYFAHIKGLTLFIGADPVLLPAMLMGAHGIVSGPANLFPEPYVQLYEAVRSGDWQRGREMQKVINQLCLTCHYGRPLSFIKEGVELLGWDVGAVFRPLRPLHPEEREMLRKGLIALIDVNEKFSKSWNFQRTIRKRMYCV